MLTAEKIENSDYCVNDVADLLMRLQIAKGAFEFIITELMKTTECDDMKTLVYSAYESAVITRAQLDYKHSCDIQPDSNGIYRCECGLIATAKE